MVSVVERARTILSDAVSRALKIARPMNKAVDQRYVDGAVRSDGQAPVPTRSIVLCTEERTGSHYLCALMASTGVMGKPYEYFNEIRMRKHYPDYPDDPKTQLSWAYRLGTTKNGIFAVKLHTWMMARVLPAFDPRSEFPAPIFVQLIRRDLIGQAISLVRAEQSSQFDSTDHALAEPVYDGPLIDHHVRELAVREARWRTYFVRHQIEPLRLVYEELEHRPRKTVHRVARFAGITSLRIIGRKRWLIFERQRDGLNAEWRARYLSEFGDVRRMDL